MSDPKSTFNNPDWEVKGNVYQSAGDMKVVNSGGNIGNNQTDPLTEMFSKIRVKIDNLPNRERPAISLIVQDIESTIGEIQKDESNEDAINFFEQRLRNLYAIRKDIAEIAILTLASPPVGVAAIISKIGQRLKSEYAIRDA
jgi:hypothetical protein